MAQQAPSQVGFLVPLKSNLDVDGSASTVPVLEGPNIIGRSNLIVLDKRVSRKHVSLHASSDGTVNLVVEGPNPVCLQCGDSTKKLISGNTVSVGHGDILELIPGNHFFKYTRLNSERHTSSSNTYEGTLAKGKRCHEQETLIFKKSRQILEDEAFARTLQNEHQSSKSRREVPFVDIESDDANVLASCDDVETIRYFSVPKNKLSSTFRLMRVQGLPAWANSSSISIGDVIEGNPLIAILSNYMVDIDWLLSACPILKKIPHVLVNHGESGATVEHLKMSKPANWILHKPPLPISYGTHHSKAMILVYPRGVRVVVHTANLIYVDWNNKSQGLWMQDFPWKDEGQKNLKKGCPFENDLVEYLSALKWPELNVNLPSIGSVSINASLFKKFDYSSATVRLIASVPGYHMGPKLNKWGHMKLRSVLNESIFENIFRGSPLIYQFSSIGSLDEKWLAELLQSMSSGFSDDKSPLGLGKAHIIWPTVEDVRCSLEGYAAGNAIPSPQKNVEKDFLKKYWARWKASHTGRCRAMPHIKTYTRYSGQNLAWFLLTSANLSKAAWGTLQKNSSQLMIRSYELGVLLLPSTLEGCSSAFSCVENGSPLQGGDHSSSDTICRRTKLVTLCMQGIRKIDPSSEVIPLPVPYELPPQPYTSEDIPWSWDMRYTKKDVYGQVWPRHVQLYVNQDS